MDWVRMSLQNQLLEFQYKTGQIWCPWPNEPTTSVLKVYTVFPNSVWAGGWYSLDYD
jgi:hypothetical protein